MRLPLVFLCHYIFLPAPKEKAAHLLGYAVKSLPRRHPAPSPLGELPPRDPCSPVAARGRQSKKSSFCFAERGFFIPKLFISCGVRLDKLLKPCLDPFVCRAQALRRKLKNRFLHIIGTFVANGCVGGNGKGHCGFVRAVPPAKILSATGINVVGARL